MSPRSSPRKTPLFWIQQDGLVSAHVDAVQTHIKNNYMRNPLAMDVFNEEICTLLKKKIKASLVTLDDLSIRFTYQGEVSLQDSEEILEKITAVHAKVLKAASTTKNEGRKKTLELFAENLAALFLWIRTRLFPAERVSDSRRRGEPDSCRSGDLADTDRNLLLSQRQKRVSAAKNR
jgi:hypothetical protein